MSSGEPPARVINDAWLSFPDARHRVIRWERDHDGVTVQTACGRWLPLGPGGGEPSDQPCEGCSP